MKTTKKNTEITERKCVKSKKSNTNVNHKTNKNWQLLQESRRYRKAATREMCNAVTQRIEIEILDGIFLNLNSRNRGKSSNVQNRILRRIVEKRQAQANHVKNGRSNDLTSIRIAMTCTSKCLSDIKRKRLIG